MEKTDKNTEALATQTRDNSVGWLLNVMTRTVNDIMKKALEPLALSQEQFAILMTLLTKDGISQSAIGKQVILPGYAMTRNLDALEERGFIEHQPDKNSRRSFCIMLTEEGKALAPTLFTIVSGVNEQLLSGLEENEVSQLKALLTKLMVTNLK